MAWAKLNEPAGTAYSLPERLFPADNWWNLDISAAPLDAQSAAYISFFVDNNLNATVTGDYGSTYGLPHVTVSGDHPKIFFHHFSYPADSDAVGYPIPSQSLTETGWSQDLLHTLSDELVSDTDRHMCMVDLDNNILYEVYQPFYNASGAPYVCRHGLTLPADGYCASSARQFDLTSNENKVGSCTAAGTAFTPGHFFYDEVDAGAIHHAINLTLNRSTKYPPYYVWPATDYAPGSASSPLTSIGQTGLGHPPLGARFRLKSSYVTKYPTQRWAVAIATCLKTYGLIFMDNGTSWMIAGSQDSRWGATTNPPQLYVRAELANMKAADFEVVELGWNPPSVPVVGPGRPIDLTTTTWTGASTDVSDASDTTYIESPADPVVAQTFTCTLQAVTTPVGSYTHQVRVRAATIGTDPLAMVLALENTDDNSVVATRTIANVPPTLADQVFGLDSNEISLIHSYAGLRIRGYALASDTTTYFVWTAVSGATSYVLQVRPSASGTYDTFNANVGNVLTYSLALVPGTYYARVVPVGAGLATAEQTVVVT